jgi:hypothetical protein
MICSNWTIGGPAIIVSVETDKVGPEFREMSAVHLQRTAMSELGTGGPFSRVRCD